MNPQEYEVYLANATETRLQLEKKRLESFERAKKIVFDIVRGEENGIHQKTLLRIIRAIGALDKQTEDFLPVAIFRLAYEDKTIVMSHGRLYPLPVDRWAKP